MKTLVTGADGFIGSHLVEELIEQGNEVKAFCYYNSFNSWGWLDNFPKQLIDQIEVFSGDVRDPNGVRTAMKGCDKVYHLAALIAIPYSYHSPDSYIDTNVKGTLNILQAARDFGLDRVIVTSTSEVYGTAKYVPIDENHPRQPQSPYSASKIGADCMAESFYRSFDLPVTIVRPFNTYGPRQSARAIIPTIISQLANGYEEITLGDLSPTRDFLFVKDTAKGFVAIANAKELIGHDCNIATKSEISMKALVDNLVALMNPNAQIVQDQERIRPKKSEVFRLYGDNEKILKYTDWMPTYDLDAGLKETIQWFTDKNNLKHYKASIYNV
jgi:NAD dependent epimerase/dehydratase